MKLHHIAAASALAASFSGAWALSPSDAASARVVFVSGASAQRLAFAAYVQELCTLRADGTPGTNDLDVYFSNTDGNDSRAYACTLSQSAGTTLPAGTRVLIIKRDAGGSAMGLGPVNDRLAISRLAVDNSCTRTANPSPALDIQKQSYNCPTTTNSIPDIGLADVEPARFTEQVNLSDGILAPNIGALTRVPLAMGIFGVAVNTNLYKALQASQGLQQVDVPADQTTWTAADIANIPSLPTTFVASVLTNKLSGGPASSLAKGWNLVVSSDAAAASKTINVLRRVEGSGTQAATSLYFAQNGSVQGCSNANGTADCQTAAISAGTTSTAYVEYGSSGRLEGGFATADQLGGYALGVIGRENNPRANGTGAAFDGKAYRFVKLDGIAPVPAEAQVGNYRFMFESSMVYNAAQGTDDGKSFAVQMGGASGMGKAATLARADADTQQGALALPTTYTGAFANQTGLVKQFSTSVTRSSGNSNSPLFRAK